TIAGLTIGGASGTQTLNVAGRRLSLAGPSSIGAHGSVVLQSGTIDGAGSLENAGRLRVVGGASVISVGLHNALGGSLLITGGAGGGCGGPGRVTMARGFRNEGSLTLNTQGNFCGTGEGSATLNVSSGTLVNATSGTIVSRADNTNGFNTLNAAIDNQGLLDV